MIGGCFCPHHKQEFLDRTGYGDAQWSELLVDIQGRRFTPMLKAWVEYTCDQLTACFRSQQKAAPELQLGIMVMYMGAEKAGIRLTDYAQLPLRVGELMFDDGGFDRVKGKTDELFSSLFHRRFVTPELAYSETTAYPVNSLSLTKQSGETGRVDDQRRSQHHVHVRFPERPLVDARSRNEEARQGARSDRWSCASGTAETLLGRSRSLCQRR